MRKQGFLIFCLSGYHSIIRSQFQISSFIMCNICPFQNRSHNEYRIIDRFSFTFSSIIFSYRSNHRGFFATGLPQLGITTSTFVSSSALPYEKIYDYVEYIISIWRLDWELITKE